jgi:hypothetical protein
VMDGECSDGSFFLFVSLCDFGVVSGEGKDASEN